KPRKPHRSVKVSTPRSAGAGSVLRHTRSAKVSGKARVRAEESLDDNRGGKRAEVLSGLRSGSFNSNLKFSMGYSIDVRNPVCLLNHEIDANVDCNVNDGSFINSPLENSVSNEQCSPAAKSCGPKTSLDHSGMGDVGNTSSGLVSSEDGIASAKTGIVIDKGIQFKSKDGMKKVLESGLWMVQNVPLGLNMKEPGIWLDKIEPSVIPIWVCVYNIPMELCNGNRIGKIISGVGKPLLMDNMTKEMCLKKSGKLDFAKVLVEVSANDDLPSSLEISYPPIGNRPAKVGVLDVKYQWKLPLCTHCKTLGQELKRKLQRRT
ncbi:60S ribosomal protein L27-like protein, partial [Tanacetum coccineum]